MQPFEKLGAFYLGQEYDLSKGKRLDRLVMYDARDLTTHAVCVGMTGSGKTGPLHRPTRGGCHRQRPRHHDRSQRRPHQYASHFPRATP